MVRTIALLMSGLLLVAACNSGVDEPNPQASSSGAPASRVPGSGPADVGWFFEVHEVGLGSDGYVALRNYTDVPASLGSLYLCQAQGCVDLPDHVVGAKQVVRVTSGDGAGLETVILASADLDFDPADGEIGLYVSSSPAESADVRAYLEWGSTPHPLTPVAVEAGLWRDDSYAPSAPHATRLWKTEDNLWVWDPGS